MRAFSNHAGYRRGGPASNRYITVSAEELDRNIAIASKELPFYRNPAYIEEYREMTTAGLPTMDAIAEMYRVHPELAFPVHEHDAAQVTIGRRTFQSGEVDDNLVELYVCRICGAEL